MDQLRSHTTCASTLAGEQGQVPTVVVASILSNPNYSFYTVFRGHFDTYHECKQKRDELYDVYNKKAMNATKKEQRTNIVSFE